MFLQAVDEGAVQGLLLRPLGGGGGSPFGLLAVDVLFPLVGELDNLTLNVLSLGHLLVYVVLPLLEVQLAELGREIFFLQGFELDLARLDGVDEIPGRVFVERRGLD